MLPSLELPRQSRGRARDASRRDVVLLGIVTGIASVYLIGAALLQYLNYYSNGWDLGVFDQVLWNTANGHPFDYSFRPYLYLGDHFSPVLLLLAPLTLLGLGAAPVLVAQGLAFATAGIPLFAAVRRMSGVAAGWMLTGAYLVSLPMLRAATFDFHPEAFVPLLAFTALWGLASSRSWVFVGASLGLLMVKEDMFLLTLGLAWLGWVAFDACRASAILAATTLAYTALISLVVMPHYNGGVTNPIVERYGYLGDTLPQLALNSVVHPDRVADHLVRWDALGAVALLLAGVAFLPLLKPRLWPPLVALLAVPLLADQQPQSTLALHYGVAPGTFVMLVAAVALSSSPLRKLWIRTTARLRSLGAVDAATAGAVAAFAMALLLFAWQSPAPPSLAAKDTRFLPGEHAEVAGSFVEMIPSSVKVSAQSTFLPRLTHRRELYEFPRVLDAQYVLLDEHRPVPGYARRGFGECVAALPDLGFERIREEDGISLWKRSPEVASATAPGCNH